MTRIVTRVGLLTMWVLIRREKSSYIKDVHLLFLLFLFLFLSHPKGSLLVSLFLSLASCLLLFETSDQVVCHVNLTWFLFHRVATTWLVLAFSSLSLLFPLCYFYLSFYVAKGSIVLLEEPFVILSVHLIANPSLFQNALSLFAVLTCSFSLFTHVLLNSTNYWCIRVQIERKKAKHK